MDISIIITTYNYGQYLKAAIKSALTQNYPRHKYEIIVVDDGSSDKQTQTILDEYKKEIFLLQRKNRGLSISCNDGIKVSRGKYLVRLDADDEFMPDLLRDASVVLDAKKEIDFVYGDYIERKAGKERLVRLPEFSENEIRQRGDFLAIGTMYRREIFSEIGLFVEHLDILEHYELVLRALAKKKRGYHIDKPLFVYSKKPDSMSANIDKMLKTGKELGDEYGFIYQQNESMP